MHSINKLAITLMVFVLVVPAALAYAYDSLNFGFGRYPDMDCKKPFIPLKITDQFEIDSLQYDIDQYTMCVEEYIEDAENDARRVLDKRDEAMEEFKRFIDEVNSAL